MSGRTGMRYAVKTTFAGALTLALIGPAGPGQAVTAPAETTQVMYALAGTSFHHGAGQPTSTEPARQYLNAGVRIYRYEDYATVQAQMRGDASTLSDPGPVVQTYTVGTMAAGRCEPAVEGTYLLNEKWIKQNPTGYGIHTTRDADVAFDAGWDCFTLSYTRADTDGHPVGPVLDQIVGELAPESATPHAGATLTVRRAPDERVIPVRRGGWTAVPLEVWMNTPVLEGDVTVTGEGRRTEVRAATYRTERSDLRKLWIRARGNKPRKLTLTVTAAGGESSLVRVRVTPKAPTSRLRPGRYESKNRKLRFTVTGDHRVVKVRGRLFLDVGGSGMPYTDWYSFKSFKLPRSGWKTTVRNSNRWNLIDHGTQGVFLQPLSARRAYVYLVELGGAAAHRALRVRRVAD